MAKTYEEVKGECGRGCKHWGWDPDGAYCVSPQVIKIRKKQPGAHNDYPYGLDIDRALYICGAKNSKFFEPKT